MAVGLLGLAGKSQDGVPGGLELSPKLSVGLCGEIAAVAVVGSGGEADAAPAHSPVLCVDQGGLRLFLLDSVTVPSPAIDPMVALVESGLEPFDLAGEVCGASDRGDPGSRKGN